ncbi:hypothetical protein BDR06DRAFT_977137 [Suillus hirtellus]|nr:hypothetical protein BDR06DRAFT_977137 [Suillus hirtellus]
MSFGSFGICLPLSRLGLGTRISSYHVWPNSTPPSSKSQMMRTRAQTAAFLLGVHSELPDVDEGVNSRTVRHFYEGMDEEPSTTERHHAQLQKIEFRVPLHTTDSNQLTTYVDQSYSESDCHLDIFDAIRATMDVPKLYQHLGWHLSTTRRMDPPHRLLTSLDIDSTFKAARAEQSSGMKKKRVAIEVVNTAKDLKQTKRKAVVSSSGRQNSPVPYTKELEKVKSKLRCSVHQLGEDTFCWVDLSQPNAPHYLLCTQDLQEWAKYLVWDTYSLQCSKLEIQTTPASLHPACPISMKFGGYRVPTEVISPIIHNHIHLSSAASDVSDGVFARAQGEGHMAFQPLKRTFALYMESDEESDTEELPQHIKDVLVHIHSRYPAMNFPEYADKLKEREKVGMSEGAAYTFQSCVSKLHMNAELAKGRRKAKVQVHNIIGSLYRIMREPPPYLKGPLGLGFHSSILCL